MIYFILFGSETCKPCIELKELINADDELKSINKRFIYIDEKTKNIFELYNIEKYPTIIIFNDRHQQLQRIEGLKYEEFKNYLNKFNV